MATPLAEPDVPPGVIVVAESGRGKFANQLLDGRHHLLADEPAAVGGNDFGPGPYDLLLMSLGSCTSMTLRLYADRKAWPLERVIVRLTHDRDYAQDCADCPNGTMMIDHIDREIDLVGPLDAEQHAKLLEIADKCPVHRTLTHQVHITTRIRSGGSPTVASSAGSV